MITELFMRYIAMTKQYLIRVMLTELFITYLAADVMHTLNIAVEIGENDENNGGINVSTDRLNVCKLVGISKSAPP
eukprot:13779973-Heterocapsa_arctica.AAC.1